MEETVSYCFALFTCGGPCRLSSFKQFSGDLKQLVYSVMEIIDISEFVLLLHSYKKC